MDYVALRAEIDADSLGLGYAGKTNQQLADLINTVPGSAASGRQIERNVIDSYEVINATVPAEWAALTDSEKTRYSTITGAGKTDVKAPNVRSTFAAMFGVGTTTRTNLVALQNRAASRADVLFGERVEAWDVARARAL